MKKFEEFFPELKSTTNHAIVILEEAFNKYYNQLESEEDRKKLISDFTKLIKSSKIEKIDNIKVPLLIEDEKYYFIDDYFYRDYAKKISTVLEEIDRGGNPLGDDEADAIFGNDEVVEIDDDTHIESDISSFTHPEELTPEILQSSSAPVAETKDINIAFADASGGVQQTMDEDDAFSPFSPFIQNPEIKEETLKQNEQEKNTNEESQETREEKEEQMQKTEEKEAVTSNEQSDNAEDTKKDTVSNEQDSDTEETEGEVKTKKDENGIEIDEGDGVLMFNKWIDTEKLKNDLRSILKKGKGGSK